MARNHLNKNSTQRRDPLSTELGVRSAPMALHPKLRAPGRSAVSPPVRSQSFFFKAPPVLEKVGPQFRFWEIQAKQFWGYIDTIEEIYGYGSIPINTIFRGMNIHKSQLF
jgi:hypothetical protein